MKKLPFHKWSLTTVLLVACLVVASYLRLWNLPDTVQFLGDQGRDAIIVSRIFKEGDLVFIGPVTSVGNMYLGPIYYYMMVPFLWLSYPSPLGPAYGIAILGIITIWLMFKMGRELIGERPALVAAWTMALSSTVIAYSRFSWNPNPAPFFALFMIYATYKAWTKNTWWWLVVAACFSVLIQLHYLTLLSAGGAGLIWLWQVVEHIKKKTLTSKKFRKLILVTILGALGFAASLTPLMLFDYKHDWLNVKAFQNLIFDEPNFKGTNENSSRFFKSIRESHGRSMHVLFEITVGKQRSLNTALVIGMVGTVLYRLVRHREKSKTFKGELVIFAYFFTGIAGISLYENTIFDHYIAYLFPVTFLIYGIVLSDWWHRHAFGKLATLGFLALFLQHNFNNLPLSDIGWKVSDIERTAASIAERTNPGDKYNLVLLSDTGDIDAMNYRYFLEATTAPPLKQDQRGETETLFIINEDHKLDKVTDSPIYEIVTFPDKEAYEVYTIPGGPEITVLSKNE